MVMDKWQGEWGERKQKVPHPQERTSQGTSRLLHSRQGPLRVDSPRLDAPCMHSTTVSAGEQRGGPRVQCVLRACQPAPGSGLVPGTAGLAPGQDFSCACAADSTAWREGAGPANRGSWCLGPCPTRPPDPFQAPFLSSIMLWNCVRHHMVLGAPTTLPPWPWEHPQCAARSLAHGGQMNKHTYSWGRG